MYCAPYTNPKYIDIQYGTSVLPVHHNTARLSPELPYNYSTPHSFSEEKPSVVINATMCDRYSCISNESRISVYHVLSVDCLQLTYPNSKDKVALVIWSTDQLTRSGLSLNISYGDESQYFNDDVTTPITVYHRYRFSRYYDIEVTVSNRLLERHVFIRYFQSRAISSSSTLYAAMLHNSEVVVSYGGQVDVDAVSASRYIGRPVVKDDVTFEWWCFPGLLARKPTDDQQHVNITSPTVLTSL